MTQTGIEDILAASDALDRRSWATVTFGVLALLAVSMAALVSSGSGWVVFVPGFLVPALVLQTVAAHRARRLGAVMRAADREAGPGWFLTVLVCEQISAWGTYAGALSISVVWICLGYLPLFAFGSVEAFMLLGPLVVTVLQLPLLLGSRERRDNATRAIMVVRELLTAGNKERAR